MKQVVLKVNSPQSTMSYSSCNINKRFRNANLFLWFFKQLQLLRTVVFQQIFNFKVDTLSKLKTKIYILLSDNIVKRLTGLIKKVFFVTKIYILLSDNIVKRLTGLIKKVFFVTFGLKDSNCEPIATRF